MSETIMIVTVYVESEGVSLECLCPIRDMKIGDNVQIFLNNAPIVAEIKEISNIPFDKAPDNVFEMKSVVKKVSNGITKPANTISANDFIDRNVNVTVVGNGAIGEFLFSAEEIKTFQASVGDTIYFREDQGTRFKCTILGIRDSEKLVTPRLHIEAIVKSQEPEKLSQCQIAVSENAAVLKACMIKEEIFDISSGVTNIGARSFERNRTIKTLIISAVVEIDPLAFAYNSSIERIEIKSECSTLAINCFEGCRKLKEVILPYSLYWMKSELEEKYGEKILFDYDLGTNLQFNGIVYSKDFSRLICCVDKNLESFEMPIEVRKIYDYAFKDCKKLKSFVLYPFVQSVGMHILEGCFGLEELYSEFTDDVQITLMFGTHFDENADQVVLVDNMGNKEVYFTPKRCAFMELPSADKLVEVLTSKELSAEAYSIIGDYYLSQHRMSEYIKYYSLAVEKGSKYSYQRLVEYAQDGYFDQYFSLEMLDNVKRTFSIKPLLLMSGYVEGGKLEKEEAELLQEFSSLDNLKALLKHILECKIIDISVMHNGLDVLFRETEEILDDEAKVLFLKCINKGMLFDSVPYWKEELVDELAWNEKYFKNFAFDVLEFYYIYDSGKNRHREEYVAHLPENEEGIVLKKAYAAAHDMNCEHKELFLQLIAKASETSDDFYEKCAILSIASYMSYCWREKSMVAIFRDLLQLMVKSAEEGHLAGKWLVLAFKQNMKRNTPKQLYLQYVEDVFDAGILYDSIFRNLLCLEGYIQPEYYYKYWDILDTDAPDSLIMKALNETKVCIPGIKLKSPKKGEKPRLYVEFIPQLIENQIVLFANPHEAITYMQAKRIPIPNEFYYISLTNVLGLMSNNDCDEAVLFPLIFDKKITRGFIEALYDHR